MKYISSAFLVAFSAAFMCAVVIVSRGAMASAILLWIGVGAILWLGGWIAEKVYNKLMEGD